MEADRGNVSFSENLIRWNPPLRMPKEAARIFLRVTNIRAEKLNSVTDKDAMAEGYSGTRCDHSFGTYACPDCMNTGWLEPPTVSFMQDWERRIKTNRRYPLEWNATHGSG